MRSALEFLVVRFFVFLTIGALAAVTTIFAVLNRKEQPSWKYGININSLIAMPADLLKVCLTVGVEEGMSN